MVASVMFAKVYCMLCIFLTYLLVNLNSYFHSKRFAISLTQMNDHKCMLNCMYSRYVQQKYLRQTSTIHT